VSRLERAGAIVAGRTNLHEFAFGFSSENPWFGPVRNPWDTATSPGGSSGGSAAAVAAGLVPAAIGTDTGGSVRVPAALCGVVGLKVTHGRIPLTGVYPLAASLDTVGPLATTVGDAALLYAAMAGHDPADPWSGRRPVRSAGAPPEPSALRFVVPHPWVDRSVTPEVAAGWEWFRSALASLGATVVDREIPEIDFPGMVSEAMYPEVAAVHRRRFAEHPEGYGPEVRRRVELAVAAEVDPYLDGLAWRRRMREAARSALATADALITPAVAAHRKIIGVDTVEVGGEDVSYRGPLSAFSALVNHMGLPALALPLAADGSPPPSAQLIGNAWDEHRLLAMGVALEAAGVSAVRRPASWA
jgi:aspartyl-tRNA(Asn)/glutamyl-tRNA(Gln) amidotransferase subunit A